MHPEFDSVDVDKYIHKCIHLIKSGLTGVDLKSVLYQAYETEYGIFDHINTDKPLAEVTFNAIENTLDGGPLDSIARTYVAKGIKNIFNLTLLEFIDLPRDIIELLINIANEETKARTSAMSDIQDDLRNMH